jgi:hypothetical protein
MSCCCDTKCVTASYPAADVVGTMSAVCAAMTGESFGTLQHRRLFSLP